MFIDRPITGTTRVYVRLCFTHDEWRTWSQLCSFYRRRPELHFRDLILPVFHDVLLDPAGHDTGSGFAAQGRRDPLPPATDDQGHERSHPSTSTPLNVNGH